MNNEKVFDTLLESIELLDSSLLNEEINIKKSIEECKPKPDKHAKRMSDTLEVRNKDFFSGKKAKKSADNFYKVRKKIIGDMRERIKESEDYKSTGEEKIKAIGKLFAGAGIGILPGPTSIPAITIASSGAKTMITKPVSKKMSLHLLDDLEKKLDSTYKTYYALAESISIIIK